MRFSRRTVPMTVWPAAMSELMTCAPTKELAPVRSVAGIVAGYTRRAVRNCNCKLLRVCRGELKMGLGTYLMQNVMARQESQGQEAENLARFITAEVKPTGAASRWMASLYPSA